MIFAHQDAKYHTSQFTDINRSMTQFLEDETSPHQHINLSNLAYILRLLQFKSHVHNNKSRISEAHPTLSKCKLHLNMGGKKLAKCGNQMGFWFPNCRFWRQHYWNIHRFLWVSILYGTYATCDFSKTRSTFWKKVIFLKCFFHII